MNKLHNIRNTWKKAGTAILLFSAAILGSCSNEPDPGIPYFRLENMSVQAKTMVSNASELGFDVASHIIDPTGGSPSALELIRYDIRSNRNWVAECNSEDASWLKIHPTEGSGDGIVRFCVYDNDAITPRSTTVVFRYSDGRQTETTLVVNQQLTPPYLQVSAKSGGVTTKEIEVERAAATFTVNVGSNIDYFYSTTKSDWFSIQELEHGVFQLDIDAYPDDATELERSGVITFKGAGDHSTLVAELPIHQSVVPYIKMESRSLKNDKFTPFEASVLTPITFTIRCNYNWTIDQPEDGSWYLLSQTEGEAYKDYTVTITPLSVNDSGSDRSSKFTVNASTATRILTVSQESGGSGPKPVEGFPVTWSFHADAEQNGFVSREERWYKSDDDGRATISVVQPERNPTNPNMSYTLGGDGEIGRILSYAFCLNDYWLFEIPEVKNLRTTTRIRLNAIMSSSDAGPKYFMLEYSTDDKTTWNAVNVKTTTPSSVSRTIQYTVMMPRAFGGNEDQVVSETFSINENMPEGTLYMRLRVCDPRANKDDKDIIPKNGGTTRIKTRANVCDQISVQIVK